MMAPPPSQAASEAFDVIDGLPVYVGSPRWDGSHFLILFADEVSIENQAGVLRGALRPRYRVLEQPDGSFRLFAGDHLIGDVRWWEFDFGKATGELQVVRVVWDTPGSAVAHARRRRGRNAHRARARLLVAQAFISERAPIAPSGGDSADRRAAELAIARVLELVDSRVAGEVPL